MAIKQLSVFLENRPCQLVTITDALAKEGINIRAMSLADTQDFGILRLIVNDPEHASEVLKANDCVVRQNEVVVVAVEDKPGSLAEVSKILAEHEVNIEYMYAFVTSSNKYAYVVLRVNQNERAEELLSARGIRPVTAEDIQKL